MKRKRIRGLCCLLTACFLLMVHVIPAYARPDWPSDTGIQAEAGALLDMDSGAILLSQNGHVEYPPASITKILTALIVVESGCNMEDVITFSETAMNSVEADSGNKFSLVAGDTMTVEDCLYLMLLQSVNQAANALAEYTAGSIPDFVEKMNEKLAQLGCTESHFENPSGLNGETQNVSAIDMARIGQAAFNNKTVLKISSTVSYKVGPTTNYPDGIRISNEHRLVITDDAASQYYYPEAKAGKTGYLQKAGNTLVTYAEKDGRRLVSVVLKGSGGSPYRQYFLDGKELLKFGFSRFKNVNIAENETRYVTGEAPSEIGGVSYLPSELAVEPGRVITLPNNAEFADADLILDGLPGEAPEGAVAGLRYVYNERTIGSAYLMTQEGAAAAAERIRQAEEVATETAESTEENSGEETTPEETLDGENAGGESGDSTDGEDESSASTEAGQEEEESKPANGEGSSFSLFKSPYLFALIGGVLFAGLAAAGIAWIVYSNKKEAKAAAERRERRRQRFLEEGGIKEEGFNRLLEEKRNKGQSK